MTADRTTKARVPPGGGKLYLCATPIGNLRDVTLRVLETLREVALIAAEDTRTTRKLLAHYDIHTPLVSYHRDNARIRQPRILEALRQGQKVALVTESGTPTISDPGYDLVRAAIAEGFPVVPVPGPSALLAALVVSGLPSDRFVFEGFLPRKGQKRHARLTALRTEPRTIVLFEAPHRLLATLRDLADTLGPDRPVAVARELTKVHEE
ncbi:MAG TPA: 16S rRNA (cytidine(1402)-2'-O)-methyltransferase, partial [Armatimonadetes bacterium]|nr:16S rRNA (cytidine(1402)-2'-O)-methyltransferase [Armatimonadota bacterium]